MRWVCRTFLLKLFKYFIRNASLTSNAFTRYANNSSVADNKEVAYLGTLQEKYFETSAHE